MSDLALHQRIAQMIPQGAHVLDLGCGDGALLAHLKAARGCTGYGVEISDEGVHACIARGVNDSGQPRSRLGHVSRQEL
jgi:methionine biosynthesis protein MetW